MAELEFETIPVYHQSCDHNHGHTHAVMGLTTTWAIEHRGHPSCSPSQVNIIPTFTWRLGILLRLSFLISLIRILRKLTFIRHLLRARYYAKYFTSIFPFSLFFTIILLGRQNYPNFTDDETKAVRGYISGPKSHRWEEAEANLIPACLWQKPVFSKPLCRFTAAHRAGLLWGPRPHT